MIIKTEPGEPPIDVNRSASSDIEVIKEPPLKMIKLEAKDMNVDDRMVTEAIESDYKASSTDNNKSNKSSTSSSSIVSVASSTEPKYCNICDIKFNYLNTFIAHKKFYCKNIATDIENNSSTTVTAVAITQSQSVTQSTATSVL